MVKKCTGDDSTDKCGKGKSGKEDPAGTEYGVGNNINKNEDHAAKPRTGQVTDQCRSKKTNSDF